MYDYFRANRVAVALAFLFVSAAGVVSAVQADGFSIRAALLPGFLVPIIAIGSAIGPVLCCFFSDPLPLPRRMGRHGALRG